MYEYDALQIGIWECVYSMSAVESRLENPSTLTSGLICGLSTNSFTIVNHLVCVVVWRT